MNGYKAFYNGKEKDIYAETSYEAQQKAIDHFKPPKSKKHMVHVGLCEKDVDENGKGTQVIHTPDL